MQRYWVYDWLEEHNLNDAASSRTYLSSARGLNNLIDSVPPLLSTPKMTAEDSTAIVAGRGLDLSGELDCLGTECRRRQADELFRHVWHYFDTIVVGDVIAHDLRRHNSTKPDELRRRLASHIELLFYLRSLGGEQLLTFVEKMPACFMHWKDHAKDAGISVVVDDFDQLTDRLMSESETELSRQDDEVSEYVFKHPELEHYAWVAIARVEAASMNDSQIRRAVASTVLERYLAHLSADVLGAKIIGAPLGAILSLHRALLQQRPSSVPVSAFELELPILNNVSTEDLIRIRLDEREMFERFQTSLRRAIREVIRIGDFARSRDIAEQVRIDLIEPELARIQQRLKASEQVLNRKSAVAVGVGVLATIAGVVSGAAAPIVASAGAGTMATMAGQALNRHLEERQEIADSDYYFLWRASRH